MVHRTGISGADVLAEDLSSASPAEQRGYGALRDFVCISEIRLRKNARHYCLHVYTIRPSRSDRSNVLLSPTYSSVGFAPISLANSLYDVYEAGL